MQKPCYIRLHRHGHGDGKFANTAVRVLRKDELDRNTCDLLTCQISVGGATVTRQQGSGAGRAPAAIVCFAQTPRPSLPGPTLALASNELKASFQASPQLPLKNPPGRFGADLSCQVSLENPRSAPSGEKAWGLIEWGRVVLRGATHMQFLPFLPPSCACSILEEPQLQGLNLEARSSKQQCLVCELHVHAPYCATSGVHSKNTS